MIVNELEASSRAMYWELQRRAPPGVPVYQQAPFQNDVWEALDGDKDDFLIYDRCGLLTFHIVLPYSFLHYPYVEAAIRATYYKDICNCSAGVSGFRNSIMMNDTEQVNVNQTATTPSILAASEETETAPNLGHHHHHRDHHHHPDHHHHISHHNQSQHQQDTNQNQTESLHPPNHHHHPQHHHDHSHHH